MNHRLWYNPQTRTTCWPWLAIPCLLVLELLYNWNQDCLKPSVWLLHIIFSGDVFHVFDNNWLNLPWRWVLGWRLRRRQARWRFLELHGWKLLPLQPRVRTPRWLQSSLWPKNGKQMCDGMVWTDFNWNRVQEVNMLESFIHFLTSVCLLHSYIVLQKINKPW